MARSIGILFTAVLAGLGLLFLVAAIKDHTLGRTVAGLFFLASASALAWLVVLKKPEVVRRVEVTQKIDISGDVDFEKMKCQECGAVLDRDSVEVRAGAVFVKCEYCGGDYQVEEKPLW